MALQASRWGALLAGLALSCGAVAAAAGPPPGPSRPVARSGNPVNCAAARQALLQGGIAYRVGHMHEGEAQSAIARARQSGNQNALAAAQQQLAQDEAAVQAAQKQIAQAQATLSIGKCGGS